MTLDQHNVSPERDPCSVRTRSNIQNTPLWCQLHHLDRVGLNLHLVNHIAHLIQESSNPTELSHITLGKKSGWIHNIHNLQRHSRLHLISKWCHFRVSQMLGGAHNTIAKSISASDIAAIQLPPEKDALQCVTPYSPLVTSVPASTKGAEMSNTL